MTGLQSSALLSICPVRIHFWVLNHSIDLLEGKEKGGREGEREGRKEPGKKEVGKKGKKGGRERWRKEGRKKGRKEGILLFYHQEQEMSE